jgi:nucleoside-diphosphate-sugar epimerase
MTKKDERVLVTGGSGFIGSHLIAELLKIDYDVYSLERYVAGRYVLGGQRMTKTVFADLRDLFTIRDLICKIQPDFVIHLASISAVSYSYDHPNEVLENELLGTINLAESCLRKATHFRQFLFAGTSEEYGNQETFPVKEDAELRPNSPYAVGKVAADRYLQYMHNAYDFPVTILRNFNTYGRKDNAHFVVERTITQMLKGKVLMLGDSKPVRDFLYVDDHVNSYLTCLKNEKAIGEVFNFCTGRGISIGQLVDLIKELTDFKGEVVWNTIPKRPLDIAKQVGDYSKAKKLLGWKPKYTLEEGLKLTVNFWKEKLNK